jgi:hypothetical protein
MQQVSRQKLFVNKEEVEGNICFLAIDLKKDLTPNFLPAGCWWLHSLPEIK